MATYTATLARYNPASGMGGYKTGEALIGSIAKSSGYTGKARGSLKFSYSIPSNQTISSASISITLSNSGSGDTSRTFGIYSGTDNGSTINANSLLQTITMNKNSTQSISLNSSVVNYLINNRVLIVQSTGTENTSYYHTSDGYYASRNYCKITKAVLTINFKSKTTSCVAPADLVPESSKISSKDSIRLNWSRGAGGTNNTFKNYRIERKINNGGWTYVASPTSIGAGDGWYSTSAVSIQGATVQFRIRTEGSAGSSYYSGWTYSSNITINRIPSVSIRADQSKISKNNPKVTFRWTGSDGDGDELYYSYSIIELPSRNSISSSSSAGTSVSPTISYRDGVTGYQITVTATDGYDDYTANFTINYNNLPSVTIGSITSGKRVVSVTLSYTGFAGSGEQNQSLTYKIYRHTSSNNQSYSKTLITTTSSTSYYDSLVGVSDGYYIKYSIIPNDGIDDGSEITTSWYVRKNIAPPAPTGFTASGLSSSIKNIFESSSYLKWNSLPTNLMSGQSIKQIVIEKSTGTTSTSFGSWTTLYTITNTSTVSYTDSNLSSSLRGSYVRYRIKYIDDLGTSSSYTTSDNLRKNQAPVLTGGVNLPNSEELYYTYRPYTDPDLKLPITWAAGTSDDESSNIPHSYELYIKVSNYSEVKIADIEKSGVENPRAYDIIFATKDSSGKVTLSEFISNATSNNINMNYTNVQLRIIAKDDFGVSSNSIYGYFNLYLMEAPYFPSDTYDSNKLGNIASFYVSYLNPTNNLYTAINGNPYDTNNQYRMVNGGEKIKFHWPKAEDYNGNTNIQRYSIRMYYREDSGNIPNNINENQYIELVSLNRNTLEEDFKNNTYYEYIHTTSSNITMNRVVKFLIKAIDSNGLESDSIKFRYGLELCRLTDPVMELSEISFDSDVNGQSKIKATFSVTDYGGSIIHPNRGINYSSRRNLEQFKDSSSQNGVIVKVLYTTSDNSTEKNIILFNAPNTSSYPWNTINNIPIVDNTSSTTTTVPNDENYRIRLQLIVYNGPSPNYKEYYTNYVTLRGIAPPFSFRKKGLGINNRNPEGKLHVSPRSSSYNSEDVAIFGGENQDSRLIINLANGRIISGIIDCGDFDSLI